MSIKNKYIDSFELFDKSCKNKKFLIRDAELERLERNLTKGDQVNNYFSKEKLSPLPTLFIGDLAPFLESLLPSTKLLIEPKIYGYSIALEYRNGTLKKAITKEGNDVTCKIKQIQNIPSKIPIQRVFQIRGELYAPNHTAFFSRRIVVSFLRNKTAIPKNISFCCFQILNSRLNQSEAKKFIEKFGFSIPNDIYCNYTSQVQFFKKEFLDGRLFGEYPNNGIVIKINSRKLQLIRENTNLDYPYWQIAIEIQNQ